MALSEGNFALGSLYGWERHFFTSNSLVSPYLLHLSTFNTFKMSTSSRKVVSFADTRTAGHERPEPPIHPDDSVSKCRTPTKSSKTHFPPSAKLAMGGDHPAKECWACGLLFYIHHCHIIENHDPQVWLPSPRITFNWSLIYPRSARTMARIQRDISRLRSRKLVEWYYTMSILPLDV